SRYSDYETRRPRCGGGDAKEAITERPRCGGGQTDEEASMRRGSPSSQVSSGTGRRFRSRSFWTCAPLAAVDRHVLRDRLEQDGGRQNVELESPRPRLSLKAAWFLTDVPTADHGALRLVPGSHVRDALPRDREPEDAVPLLVRAGTAVVVDRRLWHARGDNRSGATRRVLL